jgi:hypothetical protein
LGPSDYSRDRPLAFVSEVVRSTIPIALPKKELEGAALYSGGEVTGPRKPKPISVKVTWEDGGACRGGER